MPAKFRKILAPIDGSPNSYHGLQYAVDLAKKYNAEITLIHVVERLVYTGVGNGTMLIPAGVYTGMEDFARELLSKRKRELAKEGVRVSAILKRGDPSVEILRASRGFDLIVMGSRGFGFFKRHLLGSVSNSVVQQSKVPVLIVGPG
jgi:nucleotide-binding universal stress UspA family protein